jgi:hypothetical protein
VVKQDEILIRAGKFKGEQVTTKRNTCCESTKRISYKFSKFQSILQNLEPKVYFELQGGCFD